jgi:hypothetical protein
VVSPEPLASLVAQIKIGESRALRVRVLGGVIALTTGRIQERNVREGSCDGGNHDAQWHVSRMSESFVDCSTLTLPLRALDELRAALAQVARLQRKVAV